MVAEATMPPNVFHRYMPRLTRRSTLAVRNRLRKFYGPRPPKQWGDGVATLVQIILSQNTSNANSSAGYRQLRRELPTWDQVADAPVEKVERHIRVSGLSNMKAPRIQAILRQLRDRHGRIDLQFLTDMDHQPAYEYLTAFNGVGPKTAHCVLMFAFGKQSFPVDTHIHRIAIRLRLDSRVDDCRESPRPADAGGSARRPVRNARPADPPREADVQGAKSPMRGLYDFETVSNGEGYYA